ncbi:MAG: PAS domain S-box protein [Myxococcota bacterium]
MSETDHERAALADDLDALLTMSEALVSRADVVGNLSRMAMALAERLDADDAAVVLLDSEDRPAWVVAATDAPSGPQIPLDIARHPDIREVMRTRQPLSVPDVEQDSRFDPVREHLQDLTVRSIVLFPVRTADEVRAVLRLRGRHARTQPLSAREIRLGRICANTTAALIRNARLLQSVKARYQNKQSAVAHMERQLRHVQKFRRFFDFAGDGQLIIDPRGRILFANRTAESVLGLQVAALHQLRLTDLVPEHGLEILRPTLAALQRNEFPKELDLPVVRADGRPLTLAVTTAPVVPEGEMDADNPYEPSIILSFRDVTETRVDEAKVRRTKEFLTALIESSADGIVATDMFGRIVLFNDAACRTTGYTRQEAETMPASDLYPPGIARKIGAELRSFDNGGPGRLTERRATIVARNGELIPVNLALSIVHGSDGEEMAIVGIFADLRSQIRLEEELTTAQAKAALSERQRAALEVAGGAAHALNQPLTAIMGGVELMLRKMPAVAPSPRELQTMLAEVERMATIVDKIGRVTRYETEPYIEGRAILDIDRSSAPAGGNGEATPSSGTKMP